MRAINITDIQRDFLPGGALAVPEGDQVIPVVNALTPRFELVVATKDWHPANHGSFASNHPGKQVGDIVDLGGLPQILWPPHCVQGTPGAEFADALDTSRIAQVIYKGTNPQIDSYSGFFDNAHRQSTGMDDYLRAHGVTELFLVGLATDYCVLYTALDACGLGYTTYVIADGCRGLDLQPGDLQHAYAQMLAAGAVILQSDEV